MATLASNEKEEAWVDEGFVTYYEDRILDHYYGKKSSYYDLFGYRSGNAEKSRLEYSGLPNFSVGTIGRPGWEITESYKGLVYSKTATLLKTLDGFMGPELMDDLIRSYYSKWKFKHPKGADFFDHFETFVSSNIKSDEESTALIKFFREGIYGLGYCDYFVGNVRSYQTLNNMGLLKNNSGELEYNKGNISTNIISEVNLQRRGELYLPVEVMIEFEDGKIVTEYWNGHSHSKTFKYNSKSKVICVHIDPDQKLYIDVDLNNNSFTQKPNNITIYKYAFKALAWLQNILQTIGWII